MKIIVFIKQVPDTDKVRLDPKTGNLKREGVKSVLNPYDAHAIEAALEIKDSVGAKVCVVSMGPPQAGAVLKKALAMGCDEAYLLSDRAFGGADTLATGFALAKAAEKISGADLLIFGKCSADAETAQTGPIVAEFLDLPQVTLVKSISTDGASAVCEREMGTVKQTVKVCLPAVIAVCEGMNAPRYPSPVSIKKVSSKPFTVWNAEQLGTPADKVGIPGSPSVTKRIFEPEKRDTQTVWFSDTPAQAAKEIVAVLKKEQVI